MNEFINLIYKIEDIKYPHYTVSSVDIVSINDGIIKYRVEVCSKIEPSKWKRWEPTNEINLIELRDSLIGEILLEEVL